MQIANLFNYTSFSQWLDDPALYSVDNSVLYSMDDSVLYWLRESASGSGFALGPGLQWNDPTTRMVQCTMCLARLNGTIYNARPAQPWARSTLTLQLEVSPPRHFQPDAIITLEK